MAARRFVLSCFILNLVLKVYADDILGCGGFIKSHVSLDFSKVEIKLFTKQGSLKEKTECAPNNGYYFLPLYEKGEYVLKVEPPPGWSIEPTEIPLNVDGATDPCSKGQDVNFVFSGFGITGRVVTAGKEVGPAGVRVHLIGEKGDVRDTTTKFNGDFHFTPVIPGKYTLKAYHNKWKMDPSNTIVQVSGGNTAMRTGSLAVRGYDVRGLVTSNGKGIAGVHVVLYSAKGTSPQYKLEGCITGLLPDVPGNPICYVISADNGEFTFGMVPAGEYQLTALESQPKQSKTAFDIQPKKVNFKVEHDSVNLKSAFEVTGFSVSGLVATNAGGKPIEGAQILLDRKPVAVSGKDGRYTISNLKASVYSLQVVAVGCEFDEATLSISASGVATVPDAHPTRWLVCGTVRSPGENDQRRSVTIQSTSNTALPPRIASTDEDERWCLYLAPGSYLGTVQVSEEDRIDGLQFYPITHKINVGYAPIDGITFSQLKATLKGSIKCMKDGQYPSCLHVAVTLRPLSSDGSYIGQPITTNAKDGKYEFVEVLPSIYEVSVPSEILCWSATKHNIAITSTEAFVPDFVHTGYAVSFTMSHKSQISYTNEPNKGTLEVPAGISQHCLPSSGEYIFTPSGCHTYEPATVTYHTRQSSNMVVINAVSHSVGIAVHSKDSVDDLKLVLFDGDIKEVGPLKPLAQKVNGMFVYRHTIMLPQGKTLQVTPDSKVLLFNPAGHQTLMVVGSDCMDADLLFTATKGKVLAGQVIPPIRMVTVTLKGGPADLISITGDDGKYHFGPLDPSTTYSLHAAKESYVFTGPDKDGNFQAQKLAEIVIKLVDASNNDPLQGALVSVSGGSSYRRNLATGLDGVLQFPSLAPGEYYLKPLMKEYKFTPSHRIILVKEGETHDVTINGTRVACSGIGQVVTLGGGGLGGVTVAAEPASNVDPSRCPTEEAIAERDTGLFKIRGLLRDCSYQLRIKAPGELGITHVMPPHIDLKVVSEAVDIEGLHFIAIQPLLVTDVTVHVYAPKVEHYKTLKLRLATEAEPTTSLYSTKVDMSGFAPGINPGMMFTPPRLPADNRTYVLQLDSSLSKSSNTYNIEPIYFNADGKFKHFKFTFEPQVKVSEQDLNQPSFMFLILLGLLAVAYFNQEAVLSMGAQFFGSLSDKISNVAAQNRQSMNKNSQYTMDDSQIDQIVQDINAIKKKPKPRKV